MEERPIVSGETGGSASEEAWAKAALRRAVLGELAPLRAVTADVAREAAERLRVTPRYVYVLLAQYRQSEGLVTDLLPRVHRRATKFSGKVEKIIEETLDRRYFTRQRRTIVSVQREIAVQCQDADLPVPSRKTITRRIAARNPVRAVASREGANAARRLRSAGGAAPDVAGPLRRIEMDHTPADIILVDEQTRKDVGRPFITAAIDNYSRAIVGLVVTYEPVSSVSVGLCLAQVVTDKQPMLDALGLDMQWPMAGKPSQLYVDNGSDFHSAALAHGCEQHGIELRFRPPGQPQFGGTIERLFRTLSTDIHELPGTTFSNPTQRRAYDSQRKAAMTLTEFRKWMYLTVAKYHASVHRTLGQTPTARWWQGIEEYGPMRTVESPEMFLLDFLPIVRRSIAPEGFLINHIWYFSNALRPWIERRDSLGKFIIRRDPRDISRIWVHDPHGPGLLEVPSRALNQQPVSDWEHRQALNDLRASGRNEVNDLELARIHAQRRSVTAESESTTRGARRKSERTSHRARTPYAGPAVPETVTARPVEPFDELEEW